MVLTSTHLMFVSKTLSLMSDVAICLVCMWDLVVFCSSGSPLCPAARCWVYVSYSGRLVRVPKLLACDALWALFAIYRRLRVRISV